MAYSTDNIKFSFVEYLDYYNYNSSDNIYICKDLPSVSSNISSILEKTTNLLNRTIKDYSMALTKDKIINSIYNSIDKNIIKSYTLNNSDISNDNDYKIKQEQKELLEKEAFRQKELLSIRCGEELLRQIELEKKREQKKKINTTNCQKHKKSFEEKNKKKELRQLRKQEEQNKLEKIKREEQSKKDKALNLQKKILEKEKQNKIWQLKQDEIKKQNIIRNQDTIKNDFNNDGVNRLNPIGFGLDINKKANDNFISFFDMVDKQNSDLKYNLTDSDLGWNPFTGRTFFY